MSYLDRMQHIKVGLHSSHTDLTAVPGTLLSVEMLEGSDILPREHERIERNLARGDNQEYPAILGIRGLDDLAIPTYLRGIATNDGAALDAQTESEVGLLLDSLMGASTDKGGSATTITGDTGSTGTLTVTSGASLLDGGGCLFEDGSGTKVAREIVSGGGTGTLTLDRDHADGAPGADNIPYGSCYWTMAPATHEHTPLFIRGMFHGSERSYFGCFGDATIEIREKQPVRLVSRWRPNNWTDTTVGSTFAAPTAGDYIMGINCRLNVKSAGFDGALLVKSATLNFGYTMQVRETLSGANGQAGWIVTRKAPTIECMLYPGANGLTFGELADSSGAMNANMLQGVLDSAAAATDIGDVESTWDVGLQVDNRPGACMYVRMPAASMRGRVVNEGGVEMIRATITARRPSAGSPLRLHLF